MWNDVYNAMVQKSWLMHAVTSGVGTGGGLALAYKLLSWAEKDSSSFLSSHLPWRLDSLSFLLGLCCGIALVVCIEAWVTFRWIIVSWWTPPSPTVPLVARPRSLPKPLFKLC